MSKILPSDLIYAFAPGHVSGPFLTSFYKNSMLRGVTVSGKVRF